MITLGERICLELDLNPLPKDKIQAIVKNRHEVAICLFNYWRHYVREKLIDTEFDILFDESRLDFWLNCMGKKKKSAFVRRYRRWVKRTGEKYCKFSAFLLEPDFAKDRQKHWPQKKLTFEELKRLSKSKGRTESIFYPSITWEDIEDLYYLCSLTFLPDWVRDGYPEKLLIECEYNVGFTDGKPVRSIRIDVGNLHGIHGFPYDDINQIEAQKIQLSDLQVDFFPKITTMRERCKGWETR